MIAIWPARDKVLFSVGNWSTLLAETAQNHTIPAASFLTAQNYTIAAAKKSKSYTKNWMQSKDDPIREFRGNAQSGNSGNSGCGWRANLFFFMTLEPENKKILRTNVIKIHADYLKYKHLASCLALWNQEIREIMGHILEFSWEFRLGFPFDKMHSCMTTYYTKPERPS